MSQQTGDQRERQGFILGLIMGVALGIVFAAALDDWFLGMAVGMLAGVIIYGGVTAWRRR